MDLTLLITNYNTPKLVANLLRSVKLTCEDIPRVLVVNSSTEPESEEWLLNNNIPYVNSKGSTHGHSVNLGMSVVKTRYVLLLDSDVLILKDIFPLFKKFKENDLAMMGEITGNRGGKLIYPRVNPWFCFFDKYKLEKANIQFFNEELTRQRKTQPEIFDIGSSTYYEIMNDKMNNLSIGNISVENVYFKHYEGMTWRVQKYNPKDVDTDIDFGGTHPNTALYEWGLKVQSQYDSEVKYLENIDIGESFKESILNQYFDRIYCINLDKRSDRWEKCSQQFKNLSIKVERFSALDKDIITNPTTMTNGQYACSVSHLTIIKMANEQKLKSILIFEDDVVMDNNINEIFERNIQNIPKDWIMLYLGGSHLGGTAHVKGNIHRINHTYTTHAYALNGKQFLEILQTAEKWYMINNQPVDVYYAMIHRNRPCYVLQNGTKQLAWQETGYSDLEDTFRDYTWLK